MPSGVVLGPDHVLREGLHLEAQALVAGGERLAELEREGRGEQVVDPQLARAVEGLEGQDPHAQLRVTRKLVTGSPMAWLVKGVAR